MIFSDPIFLCTLGGVRRHNCVDRRDDSQKKKNNDYRCPHLTSPYSFLSVFFVIGVIK